MSRLISLLRASALIATLVLAGFGAGASAAEKYAVMALVGDELTIVTYQPSVGSNINSNPRQVVPLRDGSFDEVALRSAEIAIRRARPDAATVLLASSDKSLYANANASTSDGTALKSVVSVVRSDAEAADARYLILITKSRGETRLAFYNGVTGQGQLAGLGFYFDRYKEVVQLETGEESRGFLTCYAYLSVSLVDLRSGSVIRTKNIHDSVSIPSGVSKTTTHPWEAVPAELKVRSLSGLISRILDTTVPQVLAPT